MIRKFLDLAGERKKQLYLAWLFQALTSICEGAIYFMLFLAIKDILDGSFTREKLIQYSLMFLVYTVLHFVFYYFTIAKQRPVSYAMMRDERLSIAAKIKQFPLYYFTKDKISQLTSLFTTDLSFVEMNIMEIIAGFVSSMIMTVVFALMLLSVDWRMALLLFVGIIPGYILYQQFQKSMVQLGEQKKNAQVVMIDSTLEYVQGMETIKAYRLEQSGKLVENQVDRYCTASDRYEATLTNWSMGYKICLNLGLFLSLGVGIAMVRSGSLTPATYLFFAIMGIIFYRPLEALMGSFAMMNLANASLDNIAEINNLPTENEKQGTTQFADTQADVRFENVSFSYDGKREAVSHVSFSAKPGTITALVGPSGSGKSTLLNLIPGFITPKNGRILLNGKDAAALKHSDLVRHVSVVFQEVYLFQDTMMNNIRMGNQSTTDEQVIEAAKKAHCHEFIEKLPQGYQTIISEGGASLSGGERQRIAIARALATNPKVLLCDEATSALDPNTTHAILTLIKDINKKLGITVVVITHQMSVVEEICDSVAILDGGVVVEQGEVREIFANPKTAAARRLVAPNGGSAARDLSCFAPDDHVVRVTFNGSSTAKPLVASLAAEKGILVSVLSADTRDLSGQCYGSMLLKLPRDTEQAKQAAAYMRSQNGVTVEEVTGE